MTLYLGTDCPSPNFFHYPIIRLEPRPLPPNAHAIFPSFTHILFTSKNAVRLFPFPLSHQILIAVGQATASLLPSALTPAQESQEGIIELLKTLDLSGAHLLLPRSSQARHVLDDFLQQQNIRYTVWDLYNPVPHQPFPLPSLEPFKEIIFTSPSTVRAFFQFFGKPPSHLKVICQGPVTEEALKQALK